MSNNVAVVAIGGNSLVKGRESIQDQYAAVTETCKHIADMIEQGWTVAIGHGNGPQVGFVLRRSEIAHRVEGLHEVPLDVCGADTQGATGYMLQQNLYNEFLKRGIDKHVTTVVTQVEVDRNDPAFQNPSKPIGTFMEQSQAQEKKEKEGWVVVEDAGRGWRRVVPSPLPKRVVEEPAVKGLIDLGLCVVTVGGKYIGSVRDAGFWYANTFAIKRHVSLRIRNFNSEKIKVNDLQGNPVEIAAVVVWQVVDSARALFDVDHYENFVAIQSETAIRALASEYPYDAEEDVPSLRARPQEITERMQHQVQARLEIAGVEVRDARISHLAYSPEIAQTMLRRQQAEAVIAARRRIVEGAVGMVDQALRMLSEKKIVACDRFLQSRKLFNPSRTMRSINCG